MNYKGNNYNNSLCLQQQFLKKIQKIKKKSNSPITPQDVDKKANKNLWV